MHECFLALALCPVGLFSKTVCGVKSYCGTRMENADMQPVSFFNTTHKDSGGLEEKPQLGCHIQREEGRLPKGFQRKQSFVLVLCTGWKITEKCILLCTGTISWSEKVNL